MDQPIRWTLPARTFVAFDAPLSVATVDDGLDPAYRPFLREEVGFDATGDADASALAAAAGRLASKEWHPTWGQRYDRPRDPVEFRDLTRFLRALAAADARLGGPGATVESYQDDADCRERATAVATDCPECSVREFETGADDAAAPGGGDGGDGGVGGKSSDGDGATATIYECCERHHRELHREYVEAARDEVDHPTPSEAFDHANRLTEEALAIDAAREIADVAAYDPHAVRPVVDAVLEEFESQRGADLVNVEYLRELARALTHLGLVDGSVRARLVRSLADDDARIRQASAAAVASLAWERPESLLAVGDDAVPTGYLKQVFGDDGEPVDEAPLVVRHLAAMLGETAVDSREQALGALREFARTHPNAVYPLAGELRSHLADDHPTIRLYAAVAVAGSSARYPEVGVAATDELEFLAARTGDPASVPATCALASLPGESVGRAVAVDRAVEYADPSRYPQRVVREAVHALHALDAADAVDLEWIAACATESALEHAVDVARGEITD
ncbi:hypothetical protein G9C85_06045 [Halorubellus sp. JP-L1]|uniref:hypothetical protein n=1 Tax=Halorubellus sp. JP-L1 TaxID=2715753 RepID=UPI00140CDE3C|nr:hypothetical protein [Halorubellus sp. JP-L1]NHN41198.1 hypothetical protein [Halorubellus sp. JP-L1]